MPTVALVRLRHAPKEYWFDPNQIGAKEGDHVLVETSRGKEIGLCTEGAFEVDENDINNPLKPILRIASEEDLAQCDEMDARGKEAMPVFRELVEKHELDMKPVNVEFMFDGTHATFFFTAEERVDFRSLVRDLASEFHVRVDMRQIGVRDEARMLGGLGHCGEELCCARMGGEFMPVGIRMAKEQDLPLNPAKISGLCGRLMCCLRYEFEAYKDFKGRAPKRNALIETPQGLAKVVEFDTPRETVRVRFEDGKCVVLPVSMLDTGDKVAKEGERIRPCHISQVNFDKVMEELNNDDTLAMMGDKLFSNDPKLADAEAEAGAIERNPRRRRRQETETRGSERTPRRRRREDSRKEPPARDQRRRRRSVSATGDEKPVKNEERDTVKKTTSEEGKQGAAKPRRRRGGRGRGRGRGGDSGRSSEGSRSPQQNAKPRPGQHSSGISGNAPQGRKSEGGSAGDANRNKRRRRRRRGGGGGSSQGGRQSGANPKPKAGE